MNKWILIEVQNHDIEEPDTYDSYELAYEEMDRRFNKHKEDDWECNIHKKYASIQSDFANWDWMIYEVKF